MAGAVGIDEYQRVKCLVAITVVKGFKQILRVVIRRVLQRNISGRTLAFTGEIGEAHGIAQQYIFGRNAVDIQGRTGG